MGNPFISIKGLTFGYSSIPVLEGLSLEIEKGEMIGLLGQNGSGKSTLLKIVAGLLKPWSGSIEFKIKPIIGYTPQVKSIDKDFPITVEEVVASGIWRRSPFLPWFSKDVRNDVHNILKELNLYSYRKRQITELSGGEQQKVFLARALIHNPDLLLLDEPTSNADNNTKREVLELLRAANRRGITIILATHDIKGVAENLPKIVCLNKRIIAEGDPSSVLTQDNLLRLYG